MHSISIIWKTNTAKAYAPGPPQTSAEHPLYWDYIYSDSWGLVFPTACEQYKDKDWVLFICHYNGISSL